jgi:hemerythrin
MTAFAWQDEYSVGHATIDAQHRKLIDILNDLHELLNRDSGADSSAEVAAVFDQLAAYVMTHFAFEEQLIADIGYPVHKVAEHKRQHDLLLARVQEVMNAHHEGDTQALANLLPYLYGDWLIDHICHADKDYAGYL